MSVLDIDVPECRARQKRLLEYMRMQDIDLVVVTRIEHVQWLVGPRFLPLFQPMAALSVDGHATLVAPQAAPPVSAADTTVTYDAKWLSTLRNDQGNAAAKALIDAIGGWSNVRTLGCEFSCCGPHITSRIDGKPVDIEPELYRLRRIKHVDELARLRVAIAATGAMYQRAREIIEPGVNELFVFNELQAAAVDVCGEMITGTGNDYHSGARGGPPQNRSAQAGELYILDLGPAFRGYFADNARTIAVDGRPTNAQLSAWQQIVPVFEMVRSFVKPGVRCRELFDMVKKHLDAYMPGKFNHHLGHGIGLFPHEAPHLNPNWDDTFQVGEVFACEPGLYDPSLNSGIRLENNFLVTESGVELLSDFPLELA